MAGDGDFDPVYEWVEGDVNYLLRLDLPGFKAEDIRVEVNAAGKLTVRSWRPAAAGRPGFTKIFQLPPSAIIYEITARLDNGVLTLTVPKRGLGEPTTATKEETKAAKPTEWLDNATHYVLRVNLGGFRKDDVTVEMDDMDKLSVLAQGPADGGPRFFKECRLPYDVILDDVRADFEAGVLTVTAPKLSAAAAQMKVKDTRKAKEHGGSTNDLFDSDEEGIWFENATGYVMRIKLEGISKEDVRVQGNGEGGITVRGHFPDNGPCLFNQSFVLPSTGSLAGMSASFGNDILTVTVPKRAVITLSSTAVEIKRPKSMEEQAKPRTREMQVDCAKQLPAKDDGRRRKKDDAIKKAPDKATRKAQRGEEDEKEEEASRSWQEVIMRIKEESKPKAPKVAVPRPQEDAMAKVIDRESPVERVRCYCCCFIGRGSGAKQKDNMCPKP